MQRTQYKAIERLHMYETKIMNKTLTIESLKLKKVRFK